MFSKIEIIEGLHVVMENVTLSPVIGKIVTVWWTLIQAKVKNFHFR